MENLQETDKLSLDLHKASLKQAATDIALAQANSQLASANYQNYLLTIQNKYQLNNGDTITTSGEIVRLSPEATEEAK